LRHDCTICIFKTHIQLANLPSMIGFRNMKVLTLVRVPACATPPALPLRHTRNIDSSATRTLDSRTWDLNPRSFSAIASLGKTDRLLDVPLMLGRFHLTHSGRPKCSVSHSEHPDLAGAGARRQSRHCRCLAERAPAAVHHWQRSVENSGSVSPKRIRSFQ
jgi:hypothetical protein